jgi:WD40 repeat protein
VDENVNQSARVPLTRVQACIQKEQSMNAECARISSCGSYIAIGCVDGAIEIYDSISFSLCKEGELEFQSTGKFMSHDCAVLCLEFSKNGKLLASGDSNGNIKIWKFPTGKCLKVISKAHSEQAITCLMLSFNCG